MVTDRYASLLKYLAGALGIMLLAASGSCDRAAQERKAQTGQPAAADRAGQTAGASLFDATRLADSLPDSLDMSPDGKYVYAKFISPDQKEYLAAAFPLSDDGLGEPQLQYAGADLPRAYIKARPSGLECLVISSTQEPGGPVIDLVWKATQGQRIAVNYAKAQGMPADPPDLRMGLEPLYSWDGTQVVVPLKSHGLCVWTADTDTAQYVEYPPFPARPTGMACGAVPDAENRRRVFVSRWIAGTGDEFCQIALLDLDALEWTAQVELDWVVYQIGSADAQYQPWLARGSRAPRINVEHQRVPRLAMIDPSSGLVEFSEFYGEPVWETAMDPAGSFLLYTDRQRHATVRLEPAAGKLDFDPGAYDENAKLFISMDGQTALSWFRQRLNRLELSRHETVETTADD